MRIGLAILAVAALIAVPTWFLYDNSSTRQTIQWGQYPAWISAIAASVALVGVLVAVVKWFEDNRVRLDDDANQARLVRASIGQSGRDGTDKAIATVLVSIENRSQLPIHDVRVESVLFQSRSGPVYLNRTFADEGVSNTIQGTVEGTESSFASRWEGKAGNLRKSKVHSTPQHRPSIAFDFTDAEGRRWRRIDQHAPFRLLERDTTAPRTLKKAHKDAPRS